LCLQLPILVALGEREDNFPEFLLITSHLA
jgi:hypothetical protein